MHAARDGGVDEFAPAQAQRLPAHDARHGEPAHRADGDEQRGDAAALEQRRKDDDDEHVGQRIDDVDEAHHGRVDAAAEIAGGGAPGDADADAHQRGEHTDEQRHAQRLHAAREQIAAEAIGAEPVRAVELRRRRQVLPVELLVAVGSDPRREQRERGEQTEHHERRGSPALHESRTRGSSQPYSRSAMRLHTRVTTP